MFRNRSIQLFCTASILWAACQAALGQNAIDWQTVDSGGGMNSVGGSFSLSGTIGQPDAQVAPVMAGGAFELRGGFWVDTLVCTCPGDMNGDGLRNGADIQKFTSCVTGNGACNCADINGIDGVNAADVSVFVTNLLAGPACP